MAGGVGYFFAKKMLGELLGATAYTPPATWYAALFTALPSDAGGGTEVTGGSYTRVAVTNNTTNFPAPGSIPEIDTGALIDWGVSSADWGTVVGVGFYDAASAGNLGPWGPLLVATPVPSGHGFAIIVGNGVFLIA